MISLFRAFATEYLNFVSGSTTAAAPDAAVDSLAARTASMGLGGADRTTPATPRAAPDDRDLVRCVLCNFEFRSAYRGTQPKCRRCLQRVAT
eukprot:1202930-Prymnesium_polylepis.1